MKGRLTSPTFFKVNVISMLSPMAMAVLLMLISSWRLLADFAG